MGGGGVCGDDGGGDGAGAGGRKGRALRVDDGKRRHCPAWWSLREPVAGRAYVVGVDPAEGNPRSDESAAQVLDAQTGEQMALLAGKVEPTTFAGYCIELALCYNGAGLMIERNNHGHVVIAAALEDGRVRVLDGLDGRPGWLNNQKGKRVLYADAAELMRSGQFRLYDRETAMQLMSIEASTLRAPAGHA